MNKEMQSKDLSNKAIKIIKEAKKGDRILWDEKRGIVKNLDKWEDKEHE